MSKKILKLLLKLILTILALYLVIRKIDVEVMWRVIKSANAFYLLLAWLFFMFSKVFSSFRLNYFFKDLGLQIPSGQNIKLYGIGMYYNLFLPGGIGGDGYKVYLLNKLHKTPVKQLLRAVMLDRINGLVVLVFLMLSIFFFIDMETSSLYNLKIWGGIGLAMVIMAFYGAMRFWFKDFIRSIRQTLLYSFLVQLLQLVCSYFILAGLGINQQIIQYLFVFLLSSIVAVLPLTIGGVGARELVFIFSHDYMGIDKNSAVAFSLIFFLITAITSLIGVFLKFKTHPNPIH